MKEMERGREQRDSRCSCMLNEDGEDGQKSGQIPGT